MKLHVEDPRVWKKDNTNSISQLELTCDGTPCLEKTWSMNSLVSSGTLIVLTVGMKMDCLMSWSTMTRMVSKPEDRGSFSTKSMEVEFHGCSGTGSCFRSSQGWCL